MKKLIKITRLLLLLIMVVCAVSFIACTPLTYTITFVDDDGSVLHEITLAHNEMPEYPFDEPTKEATAQYTYTFAGWDKKISIAIDDTVYKATYTATVNKYFVRFVDADGTLLEEMELEYGELPVYSGETPAKEDEGYLSFTFTGWDKEIESVTGETTYTATYSQHVNAYMVTFYDLDGNVLYEEMVNRGELPVYGGQTPTLEGDAQYSYEFVGWNKEFTPVESEQSYRPKFERHVNKYTVTFIDENGDVLQQSEVEYGTTPQFNGQLPLPEDDDQYTYTGSWDKDFAPVEGEQTYVYKVTASVKSYQVKFVDEDGRLLFEQRYEFGQMPAFDLVPFKAPTTEYLYVFNGWDKPISAVAGETTYTAVYEQVQNTFSVVISHATIDGYVAVEHLTQSLTEQKLYTYTAPVVEGKTPSHEYVNYHYLGEKILLTIYYSEVDVWDGSAVSTAFVGEGTAENPYLISSGADLALLRANVNGGNTYAGSYFKMTKSIDLASHSLMVGSSATNSFAGIFDANNCAIKNIATKETTTGQYVGLFKYLLAGGKIMNLSTYGAYNHPIKMNGAIVARNVGTIENCTNYVSITLKEGTKAAEVHRYTAGITSWNEGAIISCVNYGTMEGEQYTSGISARNAAANARVENCVNYGEINPGGFRSGGIVGYAEKGGAITNCVNYGTITNSGTRTGGIVGVGVVAIENCANYGQISGSGERIAGIVAETTAPVTNCVNYGQISSLKAVSYIGGIVGVANGSNSNITNCDNYGDVISMSHDYVGGIVAHTVNKVDNCNNYGDVLSGNYCVGGIAGYSKNIISNCENNGLISAYQWVGGIVGRSTKNITNCVNNGDVSATQDFCAGICGTPEGAITISNCVNNGNVTATNYLGGIAGRPYAGNMIIDGCVNNGKITGDSYAGGILGRANEEGSTITLKGCESHGEVSCAHPGAFIGIVLAEDVGYVFQDCTTTLKNIYYVGYSQATGLACGPIEKLYADPEELNVISGGFVKENNEFKTYLNSNIAIIKDMSFTKGEFSLRSIPSSIAKSGIIFGYSNENGVESYYRFVGSDDTNRIYIDKVVNGAVTNIATHFVSVRATRDYEYRVVIENGKAYCYFWNDRLWTVLDLELTGSGVGLFAEGTGTEFRDWAIDESVTHTTVDTLIFGHSYMDFWSTYKEDLSEVAQTYDFGEYLNIGNGGTQASHWVLLKDCVATYDADLLIYMIGINDISAGKAPATIVEGIETTLLYLKEANPDLKVILFAINHAVTKTGFATEIAQTNDLMQQLCAENTWIYFADTEYAFCDDGVNPTESWFTDGLHITAEAYRQKIVPAIASACELIAHDKLPEYTVKFVDENGNVLQEEVLKVGEMPVFKGELPVIPENTDYCTYTGGWDREIRSVVADAIYTFVITATYAKYDVQFVDEDGTLLYETQVEYGQMPIYNGVEPSKEATAEYLYQFAGWDPELEVATQNAVYTATYEKIVTSYEIIIYHLNLDGSVAANPYYNDVTEQKLYTYTAPVVEGKTPSHEYVNYHYLGEKILLTIYYSEVDVWDGSAVSTAFVGEGTAENPYLISSGADLALLRANVNGGNTYAGSYFKMTKSIDLANYSLMIGSSATNSFAGIFDANNCAIKNIKTKETTTGQYAGLFKYLLDGGKVMNLSTYGGYNQTIKMNGVVVGRNYGTVENCTNYVSISPAAGATVGEVHRYTAGIVSWNEGAILSCVNYGDITGEEYPSGITSRNASANARTENCVNYGNISGKGFRTGGIVGYAEKGGALTNCVNYGAVQTGATGNDTQLGGIAGYATVAIRNCVNYGSVTTTVKACVGGIAGYATKEIENCYNYGVIKGYQYVAGIAGYTKNNIINCDNHGEISGQQWIGGITGRSTKNITNCVNNANVTGSADFVGGIVGASEGTTRTISNCVNNGNVKGAGYNGGIDGRPYAGSVIYENCINNGTVTSTYTGNVTRGCAGGIVGRTDVAHATLINCESNGVVTAKSAGAYVGLNTTVEGTSGYVIYDSCSTTLTGNAIGYDSTSAAAIPLEGFTYTTTE